MARDQVEITITQSDGWVQITNDDVANLGFQVVEGKVFVRAAVGAVAPAAGDRGWTYTPLMGQLSLDITALSAASGANRVYVRAPAGVPIATIVVDHA